MVTFPESIASIALIVDSKDQNQSFCPTAHSERFPSNPTRHTVSLSLASVRALRLFVVPHLTSITIFFQH